MYSTNVKILLVTLFLNWAHLVSAGLYVITPSQGSECVANQPCTITWLDDGRQPLLSAIGVSTVGLYTGRQKLVQAITPVDVSTAHSITFQPNPAAGPNDGGYYIAISSTTLKTNNSAPYTNYSPFFRLTGMTGSFDSPLPAATSTIPVPSTLTQTPSSSSTSTITVSTPRPTPVPPITTAPFSQTPVPSPSPSPASSSSSLSTQSTVSTMTFPSTSSTSSRMTTSVISSSTSSQSSPASSATTTSAAIGRTCTYLPSLVLAFVLAVTLSW